MKPGTRVKSAVCDTEVVVIKAPLTPITLECGGVPMDSDAVDRGMGPKAGHDGGTLLGKRYADEETGLVLLCTKGGAGTLAADGRPLTQLDAKLLPSSD